MDEAQERAVLEDSIRTVEAATGQRIRGYLAPALTHTERTLDLIAEYDFWYTCDLFQDDQPQPIKTKSGKLISMPYSLEVNDVITYGALAMDPWRYAEALKRQLDQLLEEGEESGTVMCIPLHAYLVAQPHRLRAFEEALKHADTNRDDVWITTAVGDRRLLPRTLLGPDPGRRRGPGARVGRDRIRAGGGGMSLPQEHLEYPRRRHGQDIDRYDWRLAKDRAPVPPR